MLRGTRPDAAALAGWEWRGANMPAATTTRLGLRRFIKGFVAPDLGYNKRVAGADLATPWEPRRLDDGRTAFAWFTVGDVDPEGADNQHLDALLLDYGAVPAPEPGIAGRLRDHLVRVVPGDDDLLLGRAHLAVGRRRIPIGWFVLERLARATGDP
jgi:hypothetical protein